MGYLEKMGKIATLAVRVAFNVNRLQSERTPQVDDVDDVVGLADGPELSVGDRLDEHGCGSVDWVHVGLCVGIGLTIVPNQKKEKLT